MQTVIEGNLINYEVLGEKNKRGILILHGWKRNLNDWINIGNILSQKNKVILVDLPGFGGSPKTNKEFDIFDYSTFVVDFISKLKLKDITLIGHSVGGKISIVLASTEKNLIKKLVLVDPSGINKKSTSVKLKGALIKFLKPLKKILPPRIKDILFGLMASDDYKTAGPLKETFKKIIGQNVSSKAAGIKCPTLIIWGDKDKEVPVSAGKELKTLIPNSTLRIVWNTGHDPFLEKPNKFLEILEEFI